ncbi:ATP-binding protein [Pseudomonas tremae]|uniref:ATP-binding protein n=1 Tax=Pseudomonas syringae group TaxID=136849 RepID=UPI0006D5DAF4|nr:MULTISPECIES: ATP-binding protein [Pseudomonas syringae group]KPZ28334.1 Sensor histidine kinase/response regulator [Pseudomonas coronafaciens pv. zizaniae]MCQ3026299.1 ATP-binding protein [Pseudomonas tremae]RMS90306.1 Sensor histidine kinase/response regulator [Pseudomonas coronafaciens pv. oryzae]RMT00490.1 Sensor histidine kinase/response regulator [Pseudomonas coronafaciens pv. oryzae]
MTFRHWDINTRTQIISLGPALLLTALLIGFFTFVRIQDLREELNHTGQLIANQLAPAVEPGVTAGDIEGLKPLMRATLSMPGVRYVEIQDSSNTVMVYIDQPREQEPQARQMEIFQAPVRASHALLHSKPATVSQDYLGRVLVGMSSEAFSQRQQEILLKAAILALCALAFTFLLARRLALSLSSPISRMGEALKAIQQGDYHTPLPVSDDAELGALARHINNLAENLHRTSLEQQRSVAQLIQTREEAEQANRAKSDFLAMMSHELRTPMNGVLGMLQLLETTRMTDEQSEYATLATESTEHLLRVINDILDFSRIERDALQMEGIAFNLVELINASTHAFNHSALQRKLSLELKIKPGLEALAVIGDPTRIRQILVNLIGNALKFTEYGKVCVEADWAMLDEDHLRFTCKVHDSGIGIDAERLESMFDAFKQADSSISRRYGGTGLGLPIARTLAERMGGTLHAQSEEGAGSVFTLQIPLPVSRNVPVDIIEPLSVLDAQGKARRILLVEDNPVNRTVVQAMLHNLGCEVEVAVDGVEAVAKAGVGKYALILMDCRLPVMDGYEATRRIRQLSGLERIPIIALTANALQGDRDACLQAGMDDYLPKPFKHADLQQVLQRWLSFQASATGDKC